MAVVQWAVGMEGAAAPCGAAAVGVAVDVRDVVVVLALGAWATSGRPWCMHCMVVLLNGGMALGNEQAAPKVAPDGGVSSSVAVVPAAVVAAATAALAGTVATWSSALSRHGAGADACTKRARLVAARVRGRAEAPWSSALPRHGAGADASKRACLVAARVRGRERADAMYRSMDMVAAKKFCLQTGKLVEL